MNEIIEVQPDEIEVLDDAAIVGIMSGDLSKDYVYSFKQGGRTVEGLTLAGVNEAANRRGGIRIDSVTHTETEHSWCVVAHAIDDITQNSRWGAFEQPKNMNGKPDPHAFSKAVHKAQRNAVKQLLPKYIEKALIAQAKGQPVPKPPQNQQALPDPKEQAQKAAFASARQLTERLSTDGIPTETFWNFIKAVFKVKSRNDMTEQQWVELRAKIENIKTNKDEYNTAKGNIKQSRIKSTSGVEEQNGAH